MISPVQCARAREWDNRAPRVMSAPVYPSLGGERAGIIYRNFMYGTISETNTGVRVFMYKYIYMYTYRYIHREKDKNKSIKYDLLPFKRGRGESIYTQLCATPIFHSFSALLFFSWLHLVDNLHRGQWYISHKLYQWINACARARLNCFYKALRINYSGINRSNNK